MNGNLGINPNVTLFQEKSRIYSVHDRIRKICIMRYKRSLNYETILPIVKGHKIHSLLTPRFSTSLQGVFESTIPVPVLGPGSRRTRGSDVESSNESRWSVIGEWGFIVCTKRYM